MSLEGELYQWLRDNLPPSSRLAVGLGDDAAVLKAFGSEGVVVSTDMITDGVDFHLSEVDARQVGHKALGVNLSDLAAMAARPVTAFVSLVLPRQGVTGFSALELAIELYRGMLPLAERFDTVIAGGDTNTWDGALAINIMAMGETTTRGPLTRSGAQVGDQLLVTGQLGGSIMGKHLAVEPRVREALLLHERYQLHAGIDLSDGLSLDASRLAAASEVGVALYLDTIPIADAACRLSERDNVSPLEHALSDGEDFELLIAVPPLEAERMLRDQPLAIPLTQVGEVVSTPGLWQIDAAGNRSALTPSGYEHGAQP